MPQPKQRLGDVDRIAVEIPSGTASIQAEIQIVDQTIDGWISFQQGQLRPRPILSAAYAKYLGPESLESFTQVKQLDAKLLITGHLLRPQWKLQSNLGPQLASSLNQAMRQELSRRQRELTHRGQQLAQRELDTLQTRFAQEHRDVLRRLEIGDEQLQMIRRQLTASLGSPEQILGQGKKLLRMFK